MSTILVTGGTGTLGRPTAELLRAAGHDVRVLSRTAGDDRIAGDLATGSGVAAALEGVHTVVHLATNGRSDAAATLLLVQAARSAGVAHLLYISIVGIDRVRLPYYIGKLECERIIEESGIPHTILRATQFHEFLGAFLQSQRRLPVLIVLSIPIQPIAVREVATRLAGLAAAPPAGRVPDIGGPEQGTFLGFAAQWQRAHGIRKPMWPMRLPGRIFAAYRAGGHMATLPGYGRETFAEYAAADAALNQ